MELAPYELDTEGGGVFEFELDKELGVCGGGGMVQADRWDADHEFSLRASACAFR